MSRQNSKLPNLIIAGVHKAGTTSLYSYLAKHPQICPSYKKEIGFFMPLLVGGTLPPINDYATYFDHCNSVLFRLEASPSYLYGKELIAEAVKNVLQDPRIIVILRDPVDRLESYFSRAVSKFSLPEDISFDEYVTLSERHIHSNEQSVYARGLREGIYINYIPAWQNIFGDNFRVVFFDDLKKDAYSVTAEIFRWLGLNVGDCSPDDFSVENRTLQYKFKRLHRHVKDLYLKNETFWRRHYRLKQHLRGIYNRFNADTTGRLQSINEHTISRLLDFYEPYNSQLRTFLEGNGYESFPTWLNPRSYLSPTQLPTATETID